MTENPLASIADTLAINPHDLSLDRRDAWIVGIVFGWDEALPEVAARHGWRPEVVARLERLRERWAVLYGEAEERWPPEDAP